MADYLTDSNILLRVGDPKSPLYTLTNTAINLLKAQSARICIVPQNLYEFYVVATRPASARGGLGITPAQAKTEMIRLRGIFDFRPDTADIFTEWADLVTLYGVSGVAAHDARLVAAMQVHGIANLLTFNAADFVRYTHITVLHPQNI